MQLLKVDDVMRLLSISRRQVFRLISGGQLKAVKLGRSTRFRLADVERFIKSL